MLKDRKDLEVKRYRIDDFQLGLQKIKEEAGEDAMIVNTRRITDPNEKGNFEITVSVDSDGEAATETTRDPGTAARRWKKWQQRTGQSDTSASTSSNSNGDNELASMVQKLADDIQSLKSEVHEFRNQPSQNGGPSQSSSEVLPQTTLQTLHASLAKLKGEGQSEMFSKTISTLFDSLRTQGLRESDIESLLVSALDNTDNLDENPHALYEGIEAEMANRIHTLPPLWQTRCSKKEVGIFAGPTGVGKTTTIAKVAAHAKFVGQKSTAIICADTFRIGGLYQLETYSDLIGVPTKSVSNFREFRAALDAFRDRDLILVDTRGQSPWSATPSDDIPLTSYTELNDGEFEVKYSLCLGASSSASNLIDLAQSYETLRPLSLVFTKVDEARQIGTIASTAIETGLPISHVCNGPQVPEDILSPTDSEVARWVQSGISSTNSTLGNRQTNNSSLQQMSA